MIGGIGVFVHPILKTLPLKRLETARSHGALIPISIQGIGQLAILVLVVDGSDSKIKFSHALAGFHCGAGRGERRENIVLGGGV